MVSVCLPSDALLQHLPSYLGFSYLGVGFPGSSEVKAFAWKVGDLGSIPGLGRSPGEGNGNLLQYFGHLMQRTDSLEKTLRMGMVEGQRRRG